MEALPSGGFANLVSQIKQYVANHSGGLSETVLFQDNESEGRVWKWNGNPLEINIGDHANIRIDYHTRLNALSPYTYTRKSIFIGPGSSSNQSTHEELTFRLNSSNVAVYMTDLNITFGNSKLSFSLRNSYKKCHDGTIESPSTTDNSYTENGESFEVFIDRVVAYD